MRDLLTSAQETVEADLEAFHRTMALSPVLHAVYEPDATVYWSDAPCDGGNVLATARLGKDVPRRVSELITPFMERALPFRWVTTPRTTSPALEAMLAQLGLTPVSASAMAVGLEEEVDPRTPERTFIEVAWPDQLETVGQTLGDAIGLPADHREQHLRFLDGLESEGCEFLVGRDLGSSEPLGALVMFRRRNSVLIPDYGLLDRGHVRRIARPLVATAMNRAREGGARAATTVADRASYPVFAELGFRTQFDVVSWTWTPA